MLEDLLISPPPHPPPQSSDDAVSWLIPFVISFYLCVIFRNGLPVYKELRYLAEVKRFSMAVMFLSDKDKKGNHCTFTVTAQPVLNRQFPAGKWIVAG